jgi:LytS/YehU family sensor histidine kinase
MTTQTQQDSWLKSRNLPRLAFAVVFSAPVAGAILSLVLGFTVMSNIIFLVPDPNIDSNFVRADFGQIVLNTIMVAVSGLMVGGLLGWPVMLGLGLPMHAILIRKTPAKAWHYAIAGLVVGMIAGFLRFAMERGGTGTNDLIVLLAIGGVAGAIASLMFWLVRRPDKDAAEYKT